MATLCSSYNNPNSGLKRLCVFAILVTLCALAVQLTLHALLSHGSEVDAVDQACGRHTLDFRKLGDKYYQICQMDDGSFGIRVLVKDAQGFFKRVTSFIRKTHGKPVMDFESVVKYVGGESIPMP